MWEAYFGEMWWTRLALQRGLGLIYFLAFLCAARQFRPLLGARGLLPVPALLQRARFRDGPSVFFLHYSDRFASLIAWSGAVLSMLVITGLADGGPLWLSLTVWSALYLLYLSIVNVGQTFYAFGWESMLLEAGFFAIFLGPSSLEPSLIPLLGLRWMLLRVELGAGLIKLRGDQCWRDLTALYYHHETQPLPGPLSSFFHHLPRPFQRASVAFSHFVQLVVPFGLFGPAKVAAAAGALITLHQLVLIVSGNYAWLNWLTVVLAISALGDEVLIGVVRLESPASLAARPVAFDWALYALGVASAILSIKPVLNLFSANQVMNAAYNPLHLVGSYGAFGSVTRRRYEIILEGTRDEAPASGTTSWQAYELPGKPGDPKRAPRQWAPYHLRLDWLMWFLPLRAHVTDAGVLRRSHPVWFLRLVDKLLEGDEATLKLLSHNPFAERPPAYVRASVYRYELTTRAERRESGAHWKRTYVGEYLPPRRV